MTRTAAGFGFYKDGSWIGMRTYMNRAPNGVCWALVFNASLQMDADDNKAVADAIERVWDEIGPAETFPATDLFDDFK